MNFYLKDPFRQAVEAATGGRNTVLYDKYGKPSVMVVIPKFLLSDINAGWASDAHPAFIVNGREVPEIFIGKYESALFAQSGSVNLALSLPGVVPVASVNFTDALAACQAKGRNWHLMTNAEWAAIALWCWKNGFQPRGNTLLGQNHTNTWESGRRWDNALPGAAGQDGRVLTGSGPAGWNHDNTPAGIADFCGNVGEWIAGLRLKDGELQFLEDNDAASPDADLTDATGDWTAILGDGSLVPPGTASTLKYDSTVGGGGTPAGDVQLDDVIDNAHTGNGYDLMDFGDLAADVGITIPGLLQYLGLYPVDTAINLGNDGLRVKNDGERLATRGGASASAATGGVFSLRLDLERTAVDAGTGFRVAYIEGL